MTVITPTVRPDFLPMLAKCLKRQTVDHTWLICAPEALHGQIEEKLGGYTFTLLKEPEKRSGDYYGLNKAFNTLFRAGEGLLVCIMDGLWFEPDLLERLEAHYRNDPKSCVTCIGHQYDRIENGKPEHMVWRDPRARTDQGVFYQVPETEMEFCLCSFPKSAVDVVGGVDEVYDRYAALSEKEMMARIYKAGYTLWIDQSIEYRAVQHGRLSSEWDARYQAGTETYMRHLREIESGKRLTI